jgi:hypothetical protein
MNIRRSRSIGVTQCLAILLLAPGLPGQTARTQPPGTPVKPEVPVLYSSAAFEPESRPDPFLNPLLLAKKNDEIEQEEPQGQPPPGIAGMFIGQVRLMGTSVRDDGSTAVFKGTDGRVYFLQQGDRLFDGFVKQIGSDVVQLVRETRLKSGKIVTEDITKRLRTP